MLLFNKYKIIEKISNGSYGTVYKGENIRTKEFVAIKIEDKGEKSLLKNETRVYIYLDSQKGFPQIKWFGCENNKNILVMGLLGDSLTNIKTKYGKLSLHFTIKLGVQMIDLLKTIHFKGLVHRDIKPENFLLGLNDKIDILHLIDFGFCKKYTLSNNTHISFKQTSNIIGSINYASLNVHNRIEPSRRDDLESSIYILMYLLDCLVWEKYTDEYIIIQTKKNIINTDIPVFVKEMLQYIQNLRFDECPDYKLLRNILENGTL